MNEISKKTYEKGVIEARGEPIILIDNIKVTKRELDKGSQHIFMRKLYQNNNSEEHDEIDDKLESLYNNETLLTIIIFDTNDYYTCVFNEKPKRGKFRLSAEILNF